MLMVISVQDVFNDINKDVKNAVCPKMILDFGRLNWTENYGNLL